MSDGFKLKDLTVWRGRIILFGNFGTLLLPIATAFWASWRKYENASQKSAYFQKKFLMQITGCGKRIIFEISD